MKRFLCLISFFVMTLMYATAQSVEIGGLKYYLTADSHEAVIVVYNTWSGELEIPSEVQYNNETYSVTTIAWMAFVNCKELTKVKIPKSLVNVQHYNILSAGSSRVADENMNPFLGCTSLQAIEVDEENPAMSSFDGVLFNKDKTRLYCYPAGKQQGEYTIPETTEWIGGSAFLANTYLTTVIMPNSVTTIGSGIFSDCSNLSSVKLSESISFLGGYTFDKCESLRFLEIPESVTHLSNSPFRWTGLENLVIRGTFPKGIEKDVFYCVENSTVVYVQQSEIEKFKQVFSGTVLPLDEYTGIDNTRIKENSFNNPLFDLQGRRIQGQPQKGMYIQGGKKYMK